MSFKKNILKQKQYLPFWISFLLVILISLISFHGDFFWLSELAARTANGNFNLYQPLVIRGANLGRFIMPPLIGLVDTFFYFILKTLHIIHDLNQGPLDRISLFQLLLLKSRYILVFLLSYPLIYKTALIFTKDNKLLSRRIANLWIASPILIYIPFAQGNNDIYPVVLSLVFLLFAFKGENLIAMIVLGLAAAMKNYSIFLFLPTALILAKKDPRKTFLYLIVGGITYILPSLIYFHGLAGMAHFSSGNIENFMMLGTTISSTVPYYVFVIAYFSVIFHLYFDENTKKIEEEKNSMLVIYCFFALLPFILHIFFRSGFFGSCPSLFSSSTTISNFIKFIC